MTLSKIKKQLSLIVLNKEQLVGPGITAGRDRTLLMKFEQADRL